MGSSDPHIKAPGPLTPTCATAQSGRHVKLVEAGLVHSWGQEVWARAYGAFRVQG